MTDERPQGIDARKTVHIFVCGKKGTGKTELAYLLWESYPFDKVLVDPAHDIKVPETTIELPTPPPAHWPNKERLDELVRTAAGADKRYHALVYRPDFASPTYGDDIDRTLGLAYGHPGSLIMVDEAHDAFPVGLMVKRPHARRVLRMARHARLSVIIATPRPMTVDPLCIGQADWVYCFKLPNPDDRKRVAQNIGYTPKLFDEAVHSLGDHEYVRFEAAANGGEGELLVFPALPASTIRHHKAA